MKQGEGKTGQPGSTRPAVVMVTQQDELWRQGQAICAAAGVRVERSLAPRPMEWLQAGAVLVGSDCAEDLRTARMPMRERIFAVCRADEVALVSRFSVDYRGAVVVVPEGSSTLTAALADLAAPDARGRIVVVVGATGGLGTSTLAAALACTAARQGQGTALVDLEIGGAGLDLLLGAERLPGWRWPRLALARGVLHDLSPHLVRVDGLHLLALDRLCGPPGVPDAEAVSSVLDGLVRAHDLVVVDGGRGHGPAAPAMAAAQLALLVVPSTVRGLGAAREARALWDGLPTPPHVVLRRVRGGGLASADLAEGLDLPVTWSLPEDPTLVVAAERGEPPTRSARTPFGRLCRELVAAATTHAEEAVDATASLPGRHALSPEAGSGAQVRSTSLERPTETNPPASREPARADSAVVAPVHSPVVSPRLEPVPGVTDPVALARRALLAAESPASGAEAGAQRARRRPAPRRMLVGSGAAASGAGGATSAGASAASVALENPAPDARRLLRPVVAAPARFVATAPEVPSSAPAAPEGASSEPAAPEVTVSGPTALWHSALPSTTYADAAPVEGPGGVIEHKGSPRTPSTADLDILRRGLIESAEPPDAAAVSRLMQDQGWVVSDRTVLQTVELLHRDSAGAGPLEPLLRQPGVTDVLVNGPQEVYVDRGQGLERAALRFGGEAEVRRLAQRLAAAVGRRLDDSSPFVDARLADGTRVHAVLAGPAGAHTCLSLRVPAARSFTLADCVRAGSISPEGADLLRSVVAARLAFLISGGTGSGKTTLLATLLGLVPRSERIVVVEDARELRPVHPHVVHLEGRPANGEAAGEVTLSELVRNSLRMRPDRLVVGEVRGAEVIDLLAALNTGHEGGCGTVHANSALDVPARLEALAALAGMGRAALHSQLASALHAVIHATRDARGRRRVDGVFLTERGDDGLVRVRPAAVFGGDGAVRWGPAGDRLRELLP